MDGRPHMAVVLGIDARPPRAPPTAGFTVTVYIHRSPATQEGWAAALGGNGFSTLPYVLAVEVKRTRRPGCHLTTHKVCGKAAIDAVSRCKELDGLVCDRFFTFPDKYEQHVFVVAQ